MVEKSSNSEGYETCDQLDARANAIKWLYDMCVGLCGPTRAKFYRMWTNCAKAMVDFALYGIKPTPDQYPINDYGIECCKDLINSAPEYLQHDMRKLLEEYKKHLNTQ